MNTYDHNQDPLTEMHIDAKWVECSHAYSCKMGKRVNAMDTKADIQWNKLMHSENSILMYVVYNAETLEELIKTVHNMYNTTTSHGRLFGGQHSPSVFKTLFAHSLGLHQYSINSLLCLRTIQDKYISLYKEPISQLCIYISAIRILVKGYYKKFYMKSGYHCESRILIIIWL